MTGTASSLDTRLRKVVETMRAAEVRLLTFDVFDTLVFRRVDRPADAFALVGRALREDGKLGQAMTPAMFGAVREASERRARQQRAGLDGSYETDIHAIYAAFPKWPFAPGVTVEELVAAEVEVERDLLIPDLDVVTLLEDVKAEGIPIAAISDIYYPADVLRELLALPRVGELLEGVEIYASCDLGFGKGSGLWKRAQEVLGVAPEHIVHFGDNPVDDVEKALAAGVRACGFPQRPSGLAEIKAAERRLRETVAMPLPLEWRSTVEPSGLMSMRGKVLAQPGIPTSREAFWRYGATILGPVLSGFAQWIARQAAAEGMTRVGCLMREGTLLSELVTSAAALEEVEVTAVPTWLNRRVGLAATLWSADKPLDALLNGRSGLTVSETLRILGIGLEDVPELAAQADTRLLDPTVRAMFEDIVLNNAIVHEKALAHSRQLAGRVARTLADAADPSGRLWLVDLGWGASIQADAARILAEDGQPLDVAGLYLVTNDNALARVADGLQVRSFLLDGGSSKEAVQLIMRSPEVIEQVTCDAVGTQSGVDEHLAPVTVELDPRTEGQRLDAAVVRDGVVAFHETWLRYRALLPGQVPSLADAQHELLPVLLRSVISPTPEEARMFGDWRHDEGRGSAREDPLAGVDHERLATHASGDQLQSLPMQDLYWPAGLVARYEPDHAPLVQAAASGLIPWKGLSTEVGVANVDVTDAVGKPVAPDAVPLRGNSRGNVLLTWARNGTDLRALTLHPCADAHVLRLDSLEVVLWEQGSEQPRVVRLAAEDLALQVPRDRYVTVGRNVLAARAQGASISVDLLALRTEVVYRVELIARFGLLRVPTPRGGRMPVESEELERLGAIVRDLESSVSWKLTQPLRAVRRRARPGS